MSVNVSSDAFFSDDSKSDFSDNRKIEGDSHENEVLKARIPNSAPVLSPPRSDQSSHLPPPGTSSVSSAPFSLVQACVKRIYDLDTVNTASHKIASHGPDANKALLNLYAKMIAAGADRYCVKPSSMPDFLPLYEDLPNFSEVLDEIQRSLALCIDSDDPIEIPPLLLVGPPGVGKTHFGQVIAKMLGTGFHMIPMASTTAGFVIGGSSSQWKGSRPGRVFDAFVASQYANPVFLIDEIDKASGSRDYDPLGAFYTLLENGTASKFVDEFAEIEIDTTGAIWIATCNDENSIPSPIRDRMNVFEVKTPSAEQACRIALLIYREIRKSHAWGARFPVDLSEDVLGAFADVSPRVVRRAIMTGFGNAKLAHHDEIKVIDLTLKKANKSGPIGFLNS